MPAPSADVSEFNPFDATDKPDAYSPTEAEQKTIKLVERLFSKSKRAREAFDSKWIENYKFFRGKQWKEKRPSYRHSEVLNFIFSEVQSVIVLLTDNRPNIEALPQDPTDNEFADIISQILRSKWDSNNWSFILAEAIVDMAIYGTAIGSVEWKPELASGIGDFQFETIDPLYFFPDANARNKINDEYCDYTITAIPTDVGKVKDRYPDKKDLIKSDLAEVEFSSSSRQDIDEITVKSPSDNRITIEQGKAFQSARSEQVLLITAYLRSSETEEEECEEPIEVVPGTESEVDAAINPTKKTYQTVRKYPDGRKIVIANAVLCEDVPNPYTDEKIPQARLVDHIMPREFWGVGEVDQLKSPQIIINKLVSYILDVAMLMGNPIWVVGTDSGIETDNLTNQPGLVVEKNPGSEVRREEGVQLQPFILQVLDTFMERVMGKLGSTTDSSRGIAPSTNSSGYAIEQLQEASQTKIRGKSRNVEMFLKDLGDLMVDRIMQFYTIPRIVRLTNDQGAPKYFKFAVKESEDELGNAHQSAIVQDYAMDPNSGAYLEQPPVEMPIKSKLDVRIVTGSTLPFAKAQKSSVAEKLFDKGIIDAEDYLTAIEYPNKEKILEKLKQRQAEQAQAAMMGPPGAPAMGTPGPLPPPAIA